MTLYIHPQYIISMGTPCNAAAFKEPVSYFMHFYPDRGLKQSDRQKTRGHTEIGEEEGLYKGSEIEEKEGLDQNSEKEKEEGQDQSSEIVKEEGLYQRGERKREVWIRAMK